MMKRTRDSTSLMAIFLVLFLIVVGVTVWLLDFSSQQRVFGLLVSAELVAFAVLAYFYYVDDPKDLNRKWITAGFVSMAAVYFVGCGAFRWSQVPHQCQMFRSRFIREKFPIHCMGLGTVQPL